MCIETQTNNMIQVISKLLDDDDVEYKVYGDDKMVLQWDTVKFQNVEGKNPYSL